MTIDTETLRDLLARAMPGPWSVETMPSGRITVTAGQFFIAGDDNGKLGLEQDNAHLIAVTRNALPGLLDTIDAQAAQLAAYPADWRKDSSLETWFPLSAQQQKDQAAEIERLRDMLRAVVEQLSGRQIRSIGDAPGHSHDRPGIWDDDNSELSGQPCAWCALWKEAVALQGESKC